MENALWYGELLQASEIAENYEREKEIRIASGRKELRCADPDCLQPVVRYCHGEILGAYFAHLDNETCDYAEFDKGNSQIMRKVRRIIYESFQKKGYHVQMEVKVLPHHYTHLLFDMPDGARVAVELGTQRLSAGKIDALTEEYRKEGIAVRWIVIGNTETTVRENQTFFIKRYLLNESRNKDLLVVNWDCLEVAQYVVDTNRYIYNGRHFTSKDYPETYTEYSTLDALEFDENHELTFEGFHTRYREWLDQKKAAYRSMVAQMEEESLLQREAMNRQMQEEQRRYRERQVKIKLDQIRQEQIRQEQIRQEQIISTKKESPAYAQRRREILPYISQQVNQVRDSMGRRWIQCEVCGAVETDDKFSSYGGENHVNLGVCDNCRKKRILDQSMDQNKI